MGPLLEGHLVRRRSGPLHLRDERADPLVDRPAGARWCRRQQRGREPARQGRPRPVGRRRGRGPPARRL